MANIEHTDRDAVLRAYDFFECPNFSIWFGRDQRYAYEGDNQTEGREKLDEALQMIEASPTPSVYTLKVYPENVHNISSKTAHKSSCSFRLNNNPVFSENGSTFIFPGNQKSNLPAVQNNSEVVKKIGELQQQNKELIEQLHKKDIEQLKNNFTQQISGIRQMLEEKEKPSAWERVGEYLIEQPDRIDNALESIGKMFRYAFGGGKNFIQDRPATQQQVNGTNKNEMDAQQTIEIKLTDEGAMVNPLLTSEEKTKKNKEQFELLQQRLTALPAVDLDELQMSSIQVLETRIGPVNVTHLLLAVACLDNDSLNKVLSNLS